MTALVTGATGFVGSAVVHQLLGRGEQVRVLARQSSSRRNIENLDVEIAIGDLRDKPSLERALAGIETLYHVAADYRLWVRDPAVLYASNVDGTANILEQAVKSGVRRIVYTSSVCTLGLRPDAVPADENTPVTYADMIGHYKKSKFQAEQIAREMAGSGAPIVIVHPSTPIGPRDIAPTPTGRMVYEAATGKMPAYVDTGLNIVHVDDVAHGHLLAAERGKTGQSYILGGENFTLKEILTMIAAMTGRRAPTVCLPRWALFPVAVGAEIFAHLNKNRDPFLTCDGLHLARKKMFFSSERAKRELGYQSRPARQALRDAIASFGVLLAETA